MVKLYSKPACVQCTATKKAFDKKGIKYDLVDLSLDQDALEFVASLGYRAAPVVFVDESTHWAGFRPEMISKISA